MEEEEEILDSSRSGLDGGLKERKEVSHVSATTGWGVWT